MKFGRLFYLFHRPAPPPAPPTILLAVVARAIEDLEAGRSVDVAVLRALQAKVVEALTYPDGMLPPDAEEATRYLAAVAVGLGRAVDAIDWGDVPAAKAAIQAAFRGPWAAAGRIGGYHHHPARRRHQPGGE